MNYESRRLEFLLLRIVLGVIVAGMVVAAVYLRNGGIGIWKMN